MPTAVIKPPNLKKLLGEQQQLLVALPRPPTPSSVYLSAPVLPLTSVYHSRGAVTAIEDRPRCADGGEDEAAKEAPLLSELLNAAPRVSLDVEKTLSLACKVLAKAHCQSLELSGDARESLGRITDFGTCCPALTAPPA
ncbi:hypothetical protein DQ04_01751130 [Trypanosoma grayi]|uniref:hypothetical protein n=1 Tax=Trypanosoma grayi TaxID=71804 RepID=UPI0004F469B6|nr:hypothetical protein DQ04_01751130 [Trypanosoma grayi]KEG12396.1 hypothetical protein DQ04_01751130 [Trypanosoma grayi]